MADKPEHSPLPWGGKLQTVMPDGTKMYWLTDGVSLGSGNHGDFEFIVRAVNSHYKLIEALVLSRAELMAVADAAVESGFGELGDVIDNHLSAVNRIIEEARGE